MVKNCPPGVLCVDNLFGFILIFIFIAILVYFKNSKPVVEVEKTDIHYYSRTNKSSKCSY